MGSYSGGLILGVLRYSHIYCRGGGCNKRVGRKIDVFMSALFDI